MSSMSIFLVTFLSFFGFISNTAADGNVTWDSEAYKQYVDSRPVIGDLPRAEVTWDPIFEEAWDKIEAANGFDMKAVSNMMPDFFFLNRWKATAFRFAYKPLSDRWLDKSLYYHELDDTIRKTIYRVAGATIMMPTKLHFDALKDEKDPNDYQFVGVFTYKDGTEVSLKTGVFYNRKTGRLGGDKGMGGLGLNYMVNENVMVTTNDIFLRKLGYMKLYDDSFLKTSNMANIDTVRMTFEYNDEDYLLQLWKGRYLNLSGGEVGMYKKPDKRLIGFYDTLEDDERIGMSFKLTNKNTNKAIIDHPLKSLWWACGFANVPKPLTGKDLKLESTIAPGDNDLLDAIKTELDKEVEKGILTYTTLNTKMGKAVRVVW